MMRIFDLLFPPRADELLLRTTSLETFLPLIAPRLVDETRPATVSLLSFGNIHVRAAIHEAKYHGSRHAFTLLGAALSEYLQDMDEFSMEKTIVHLIPVPLGHIRRKERGFNQTEEVALIALKMLAGQRNISVDTTLLERTRETASQVSLPRGKREENMHGAFRATGSLDPTHLYIVLDDVVTTGATLQAAMTALEKARAEQIVPLALAH